LTDKEVSIVFLENQVTLFANQVSSILLAQTEIMASILREQILSGQISKMQSIFCQQIKIYISSFYF
jgi:hypothetical protein